MQRFVAIFESLIALAATAFPAFAENRVALVDRRQRLPTRAAAAQGGRRDARATRRLCAKRASPSSRATISDIRAERRGRRLRRRDRAGRHRRVRLFRPRLERRRAQLSRRRRRAAIARARIIWRGFRLPISNGANGVLDDIERKGAELKVAIIDACRDNPFPPPPGSEGLSLSRGLRADGAAAGGNLRRVFRRRGQERARPAVGRRRRSQQRVHARVPAAAARGPDACTTRSRRRRRRWSSSRARPASSTTEAGLLRRGDRAGVSVGDLQERRRRRRTRRPRLSRPRSTRRWRRTRWRRSTVSSPNTRQARWRGSCETTRTARSIGGADAVPIAVPTPVPLPAPSAPCGGLVSLASLASRGVGVLSTNENCALKRGDVFKECEDCPEMVVIPNRAPDPWPTLRESPGARREKFGCDAGARSRRDYRATAASCG